MAVFKRISKAELLVQRSAGFTVLELLVTVAVAATLGSIGLFAGSQISSRWQFDRTFALLSTSLERAALYSLQQDETVTVVIDSDKILITSLKTETGSSEVASITVPPQVDLQFAAPSTGIKFYSVGVATPATISMTSGDKSCTLTISLRARVKTHCSGA